MNDGDLISRNAMINMCKEVIAQEWNHKAAPASWAHAYESFVDSLETAPAVDAVEVVRCRDCKYLSIYEEICESCGNVDEHCGVCKCTWNCTRFDGYCNRGERRNNV